MGSNRNDQLISNVQHTVIPFTNWILNVNIVLILIIKVFGFAVGGLVGFYLGIFIALIPCVTMGVNAYCTGHGGYGMLIGVVLGCILAVILGLKGSKALVRFVEK